MKPNLATLKARVIEIFWGMNLRERNEVLSEIAKLETKLEERERWTTKELLGR